ncbi:pyruvate, water dikinase regulatory protein [Enemella sp. A6]|uniref:pyruvate, water dikinase regulatory protein n=1 Tax=Enemella sp. A6 TaxID=3440152 RepID=UPI003EB6D811
MPAQPLEIHVIADSTGETAARLARAAQAQFPQHPFVIVRHPRIASAESLYLALDDVRNHERPAAVFSTLVNSVLRDLVDDACNDMGIVHCDLLGPTLSRLEVATGTAAERVPMRPVGVEADYFTRIAAMEFAVRHDDGQLLSGLAEAEIVLIGPSRSGKTPLSMYLGYLGYRTANVPLVNGIPYPPELARVERWRLVGLTIDPQRLAKLRDKRVQGMGSFNPKDGYADLARIYTELDEITAMQRKLGARIVDTTNIALEESAARVIDIVETRARMAGTHLRRQSSNELTVTP